ncbi:hypothetical protein [Sulfolobus acidocaldarius]|uniref:Conserved Crenarchaeal protein n=4 Tax=Sulfolobus acidocaldarius TaxID=2285 RepID=Q4J972_SULAC|nr:hypothetical protein [Sulfolobus acidocaldarius]AHC51591.1 hypothetical protein SUSAZ_06320 [Sulfolobus acidocaldarius SUSAZ]AAY80658.1 conserved Crenarchaeal protein [Sulfolobus acidocaldarius DSM 639]AGE71255.1 hypothetical protein SacN8_06450 [Sulfolobus acidocaldarius N8]AGE73524.1 hypothetical protein SacRon12I_06440 [Sulfolobus acidocaldarius Ron12/I]ALU30482.1 hypothetical protein ATY89_11385 [Sulfolobus acidocaldarius]
MSSNQPSYKVEFEGKAKIGEVLGNLVSVQLKPEDFASPLSLQMAISRLYNDLMQSLSQGPKKHYVAEVRFNDSMGNPVNVGVDFGQNIPPLSRKEVKVKITIEFYDEE